MQALTNMLEMFKDIKQKVKVKRGGVFAAELLLALRLFVQRALVAEYDTLNDGERQICSTTRL